MATMTPAFTVTVEDVEAWVTMAEPGDELVYATGIALPASAPAVVAVRDLVADGLVRTHMRRVGKGFEYFAIRRAPEVNPVQPPRHVAPPRDDGDTRVLRVLTRAANLRQVCPTNAEIARECGLKDAVAASYRLRKLIADGAIKSEDQGPNQRRIVTIVGTGASTIKGAL